MSSSESSPASSTGSRSPSRSPAPNMRRMRKCLQKKGHTFVSPYRVKRGTKKSPITGKVRKAYSVGGRCVSKPKSAWMSMVAETFKVAKPKGISFSESLQLAKPAYAKYAKTHTGKDGKVTKVMADIKAAAKKAAHRKH